MGVVCGVSVSSGATPSWPESTTYCVAVRPSCLLVPCAGSWWVGLSGVGGAVGDGQPRCGLRQELCPSRGEPLITGSPSPALLLPPPLQSTYTVSGFYREPFGMQTTPPSNE